MITGIRDSQRRRNDNVPFPGTVHDPERRPVRTVGGRPGRPTDGPNRPVLRRVAGRGSSTAPARRIATASTVDAGAPVGASINEYSISRAAATRANRRVLVTAMGSPNTVHGAVCTTTSRRAAARDGVLDVLCSDGHRRRCSPPRSSRPAKPLHWRVAGVTTAHAAPVGLHGRAARRGRPRGRPLRRPGPSAFGRPRVGWGRDVVRAWSTPTGSK